MRLITGVLTALTLSCLGLAFWLDVARTHDVTYAALPGLFALGAVASFWILPHLLMWGCPLVLGGGETVWQVYRDRTWDWRNVPFGLCVLAACGAGLWRGLVLTFEGRS